MIGGQNPQLLARLGKNPLGSALKSYGGYRIGSGKTIITMLNRILEASSEEECDCIEEIQFWSHGSSGNAMWISETGDEITADDFDIPELDKDGGVPRWWEKGPAWYSKRSGSMVSISNNSYF